MNKIRLTIYHKTIAPYRIDFFNHLFKEFDTDIWLEYKNLKSQKFNYDTILRQLCFTPRYLKAWFKVGDRMVYHGYRKSIKRHQPDIVIVNEFGFATLFVLLIRLFMHRHFRIVTICDDSHHMVAKGNDFQKEHRLGRKVFTPLIDEIILPDKNATEWYRHHYGKGIYFPIIYDDKRMRSMYADILGSNPQKKKGNTQKTFLFVGRLVGIKNVGTLIEAFSRLDQDENKLIIVGDGDQRNNLEKQAEGLNVTFTGRLEGKELFLQYLMSDVFVLPSRLEPFGAVTNEALIAGCWCIVSENAGSSSLIKEGQNGNIFNPDNTDELAALMNASPNTLLQDNQLRKNGMTECFEDYFEMLCHNLYKLHENEK